MGKRRAEAAGSLGVFRQFFALQRDVLVLSLAMFAFSLGFQMTTRYLPECMIALGASGLVVGLFGTFGNIISAVYPYRRCGLRPYWITVRTHSFRRGV